VIDRIKPILRPLVWRARRLRGVAAMRLGQISSQNPLSTIFGYDRGKPIDRFYIERFLANHAGDVRGHVLEVGDDSYSRRFGQDRITRQDVLHIHADNPAATIVGDLTDPATLPASLFDCIILTQTLHVIYDMPAAVRHIRRALRPGGVALLTVPGITPVRPGPDHGWYWSLTADALRELLGESFDSDKIDISTAGNLLTATAFLHGAAVEDMALREFDNVDAAYPVTVSARAVA
jgi:SAM-dependent methyltransferase